MFFYGMTDIGKKRTVNQDNFRIKEYSPDIVAAVVCDGMGGARGGGVASSLAISAFIGFLDGEEAGILSALDASDADEKISDILRRAVGAANDTVFSASEASAELSGMGTTLVCALITPRSVYSVNVGDSRMYIYSNGTMTQVTKDHSYVQYLVDIGKISPQKAKKSSQKNIITRAVGTEDTVEADVYTVSRSDTSSHSFALLCTDGLTNMVATRDIAAAFKSISNPDTEQLQKSAEKFVSMANQKGGSDNITVIILAY